MCDRRQCKWSEAVMREYRHGFRGVRVGEASNPGPPTTHSRARMEEEEAEAVLSGLEAALTRIDDSSDVETCMPTWKDYDCEREEMGRRADVRNVWARVGDVECHTAVDPGSLERDECSSVRWRTSTKVKVWSGDIATNGVSRCPRVTG